MKRNKSNFTLLRKTCPEESPKKKVTLAKPSEKG